jgi:hypothetical protein
MKDDYIERRVKLNRETTVVIKSRKDKDSDIYRNTVTLTHESADMQPLQLGSRNDIQQYIQGVDLEDDQMGLFPGGN